MTIGARIRQQRKALGLTQKTLGEQAGIAEPTIRKYESDRLHPKYETLEKLAAPLGVTAGYLRDGRERLGDHLPTPGGEKTLTISMDTQLETMLAALAEQQEKSLEELARQLLSDAAFAALERALACEP